MKLCECGCGYFTPIAKKTWSKKGWIKGQPKRFINGHNTRLRRGKDHPLWKNGRRIRGNGYITILMPEHPRVDSAGYVREHILIVEKTLGKPLPLNAIVHHVDGNPTNNNPSNLVICQDNAYHHFLHQRMRALKICGHVNWRKCGYCHQYDSLENLMVSGTVARHKACANEYERKRKVSILLKRKN